MKQLKLTLCVFILLCLSFNKTSAQTLPYTFQNSSRYADNEIYIGLVGQFPGMGNVWMDMTQSQLQVMSYNNNTVPGPAWGNTPDGKNKYAAMFFKLSDIPNKTIQIPQGLFACRLLISFKSPMYIYFHQGGGYAGADLQNPNDPNDGIRWELVELTWGDAGLWTNTSRVDAYQYPMGLEVTGYTGGISGSYASSYNTRVHDGSAPNVNKKIGEVISHQTILNTWTTKVETPFWGCKVLKTHSMDGEAIIEQASKIPDFKSSGPYKDYFASYIDDIWSTYSNKDLLLNIGDRGTWRGRVTGNRFDFYDPADNSQATIYIKPTTQDAIEGAGALATTYATAPSEKYNEDLMIQAQVCAAINRHAIYTNAAVGEVQYNADATRFFKVAPFNQYVSFFHNTNVSYQSQTYAFAYDDVGDQSSTIQCTFPTNVKVIIGGYGEIAPTPISIPGKIEGEAFSNMLGIQTEATTDAGGGADIGYIDSNDWVEYDINVTKTASYDFTFRTASLSTEGSLYMQIDGATVSQTLAFPVTGGWQTWTSTPLLQSIPLTQGTHKLKLFFVDGLFNINYINVTEHIDVCTASITSPSTSFCQGGNVVLTASAGSSYKWMNGTTQVGTAQSYTATAAGSYTVEVTNAAGCKATSSAKVITVDALPTASITSSSNSFCQGGNVVLTASAGSSYKWMNGSTQVGTAQAYTVTAAGSYTVEVSNAAGCKATSAAKVIIVDALPTATITSQSTSFCQGGNVVLTASAGSYYKWVNGTAQVGTAQTYTATAAGSYTVEVTNAAGCKAISAAKVITVDALPTPSITSTSTSFCQGGNVVLTASAGSFYKWMNGTAQVGTAQTYTAATAGSYTVEVSNAAGCKATPSATIITMAASIVWYADIDNDGKGDAAVTQSSCVQPLGYVSTAGDACPTDVNKVDPGNCGCGNTEQSCVDCAGVANGTASLDVCNICSGGTTGIRPKVNLSECTATAVTNPTGIELISVYPNPFENKITIDTKGSLVSFYIYDVAGSLVETVVLDSEAQIGEQLQSGIYLVRYKMNTTWYQFKIIKM